MLDIHNLQQDLLFAPIFLLVTLIIRQLIIRFGWAIEERVLAQGVTFLIIILTKVLFKNVRRNPQAQSHAINVRQEIEMLRERLKPPKVTLG